MIKEKMTARFLPPAMGIILWMPVFAVAEWISASKTNRKAVSV